MYCYHERESCQPWGWERHASALHSSFQGDNKIHQCITTTASKKQLNKGTFDHLIRGPRLCNSNIVFPVTDDRFVACCVWKIENTTCPEVLIWFKARMAKFSRPFATIGHVTICPWQPPCGGQAIQTFLDNEERGTGGLSKHNTCGRAFFRLFIVFKQRLQVVFLYISKSSFSGIVKSYSKKK